MMLHSFRIVVTNSRRNSCCIRHVKLNGLVAEFQLSPIEIGQESRITISSDRGFVCSCILNRFTSLSISRV